MTAAVDRQHWREHLAALDYLRQGIHLRGYAQKNPKQEYKREAFELFSAMLDSIRNEVTRILMTVQIQSRQDVEKVEEPVELHNVRYQHADYEEALAEANAESEPAKAQALRAPGPEGRTQRPMPVRLRQEVQAVPRQAGLTRPARRPLHTSLHQVPGCAILILGEDFAVGAADSVNPVNPEKSC